MSRKHAKFVAAAVAVLACVLVPAVVAAPSQAVPNVGGIPP